MIKREITETIYEYDKEGKLLRKTVTETNETEENTYTNITYPNFVYTANGPDCAITTTATTTADINMSDSIQGTCGNCNSCCKCN